MNIETYFKQLDKEVRRIYSLATEAREKGFGPVNKVEIPLAMSMAEKVVGLISTVYPQMENSGIVNRILELEKEYGKLDTAVAFKIAEEISKQKFELKRRLIKETLGDFQFPDPQKSVITRISKRLARHKDELFTFLDYPGLPYHNNHAERLIRPSVLLRKITFGNRSLNGALNHDVLMSLQQTAGLNGKDPLRMLNSILTYQKKLPLSLCLGP